VRIVERKGLLIDEDTGHFVLQELTYPMTRYALEAAADGYTLCEYRIAGGHYYTPVWLTAEKLAQFQERVREQFSCP